MTRREPTIRELAADLPPVRRLPAPPALRVRWIVLGGPSAAAFVTLCVALAEPRVLRASA